MNNTREKASKNTHKISDTNFTQNNGKVHIFPFIIRNGYENVTEVGFVPKGENPYWYSFFQKVFTGRETITATWEDSTELNVRDASKGTYNYDFKVGKYYEGMIVPGTLTQSVEIEGVSGNDDFLAMQESSEVTIVFSRNEETDLSNELNTTDFIPTEDDLFKLYIIPETKLRNKWLYISNVTTYTNPKNAANILTEVTFTSLKDKLETSGRALEQYVQYAAPGEPYAFPFITLNGEVIVSPIRLYNNPVKYLQVELQGANAFSSFLVFGRKLYWDDVNNKWYTSPSKFLFPYKMVIPQANSLNKTSAPSKNFYVFPNETIQTRATTEWLKAVKAAGSELAPLQNMGAFTMSGDWSNNYTDNLQHISNKTTAQHPSHYDYNDVTWKPLQYWDGGEGRPSAPNITTNGNMYCTNNIQYLSTDNLIQILIKNSMCNLTQLELPLDMIQTRPYRWSTFKIIGFWTRWAGDRAINQNTINVRTNHICYLIDTNLATLAYNSYVEGNEHYGNLQMFNGEDAPAMLNPQAANTTMCFRLTDLIQHKDTVDNTVKTIDTVLLSQTKDENGNWIHNDHSAMLLNCNTNDLEPKYTSDGFVIDYVLTDALHIGKIKISCYSDEDDSGYGACDKPIFTQTVMSNSMFEQHNIRNWTTILTLGSWDENWSSGTIEWPFKPQKELLPYIELNLLGTEINNQELFHNRNSLATSTLPLNNDKLTSVWYEHILKEETVPYQQLPGSYTSAQDILNNVETLLFDISGSIFDIKYLSATADLKNKNINLDIKDFKQESGIYKLTKTQSLAAINTNDYNPFAPFQKDNARYIVTQQLIHKTEFFNGSLNQMLVITVELRDDGFYYKIVEKILASSINWAGFTPRGDELIKFGGKELGQTWNNQQLQIKVNKLSFVQKVS